MQNNKLNDERYVLNKKEKEQRHVIKEVYPDSIAEELEIEAGDVLLAINDQAIQDVFDYRYLIKNEYIEVLVEKQDGEEWLLALLIRCRRECARHFILRMATPDCPFCRETISR